jgi:hypothetical protein
MIKVKQFKQTTAEMMSNKSKQQLKWCIPQYFAAKLHVPHAENIHTGK